MESGWPEGTAVLGAASLPGNLLFVTVIPVDTLTVGRVGTPGVVC